jgi:hypothetical protein
MGRRRKRKRQDEDWQESASANRARGRRWSGSRENEEALAFQDGRGKRRRRFEPSERRPEPELDRPKPAVTCYQCGHLIVTRSLVKHVSQSWDRAIAFPTLTCFQQHWTLEDPDSVPDHASVSEYLVGGAERCPDFTRGLPRDHGW